MRFALIVVLLFSAKVVLSACDFGEDLEDDYGSSSGGSYTLSPRVISQNYGTSCNTQVASICAGAEVYYNQYVECVNTYTNDPTTQAQCEGYYDQYVYTANLCQDVYNSIGC